MKQQHQSEKHTEINSELIADLFVENLADRYIAICKENKHLWFGFERDCLISAEDTCLKSGNFTKL